MARAVDCDARGTAPTAPDPESSSSPSAEAADGAAAAVGGSSLGAGGCAGGADEQPGDTASEKPQDGLLEALQLDLEAPRGCQEPPTHGEKEAVALSDAAARDVIGARRDGSVPREEFCCEEVPRCAIQRARQHVVDETAHGGILSAGPREQVICADRAASPFHASFGDVEPVPNPIDVAAATCDWQPGDINRPLERLMFGESPSQETLGNAMLGELLDTPPEVDMAAAECENRGGGMPQASAREVSSGPRLAVWYMERPRGEETTLVRADENQESILSRALATALAGLRRTFAPRELSAALRRALGGVDISGLRCVPLDGQLAGRLPPELVGDPRVSAVRLPGGKAMVRPALAGAALSRAKAIVEEILRMSGPAVFKIGITCSPLMRYRAYEREGYGSMHLLHATEEPGAVQMLEAALIDAFQGRVGCRNVARGGEGPVGRAPYFAYLALAPCGNGVGLMRKRGRLE